MMNSEIMKKSISLIILLVLSMCVSAQGLRHSVCIVYPEYTESEKSQLGDYSLHAARIGLRTLSRTLSAYKSDNVFGSGVLIDYNGRKLVLTNRHVTGYAQTVNIIFQLNNQTIRYEHCPVLSHSMTNDLAIIKLPESCKQIPLDIATNEVEDGSDISAAGFPSLGNKPSWQLTRGSVSNAQLDMSEFGSQGFAIQHTASIDPGSSGGPLLMKKEGKYHILGINTWKASYREGVGIAIAATDIQNFLSSLETPITHNQHLLEELKDISGEEWAYMLRHLPDSTQHFINEMDWNMPLDPIEKTIELAKNKETKKMGKTTTTKTSDMNTPHIETDMENRASVSINYENFFNSNQRIHVDFSYAWLGYIVTGFELGVPLWKCAHTDAYSISGSNEYKLSPGISGGLFLGGQIPIYIRRFLLIPRITQGVTVGTIISGTADMKMGLTGDTRIGMNVHFPGSKLNFILGAYYDFNVLWTSAQLEQTYHSKKSDKFTYLQHGIGVSIGVAW